MRTKLVFSFQFFLTLFSSGREVRAYLRNQTDIHAKGFDFFTLLNFMDRRDKRCLKFVENTKHRKWFKVIQKTAKTWQKQTRYCKVVANKGRYQKSPIGYLTSLLDKTEPKWFERSFHLHYSSKVNYSRREQTIAGHAVSIDWCFVLCNLSLGK